MVACSDSFTPHVCAQLQTRPGAGDCGPCACIEAFDIASCGKFVIGDRARRTASIIKIRDLGGSPNTGSTKNSEMFKAFTSTYYENQFKDLGYRKPAGKFLLNVDWSSVFLPQLRDLDRWASISVVYTRIDAYDGGSVSGQPGYTGNHQIVIGEYRVKSGNAWVTMVDPLADGRRAGVANGPQAIRLSVIEDAAADYAGSGNASGWSFWPVGKLPGGDPGDGGGTTTVPNIINDPEATAISDIFVANLLPGNRSEAYHASIVAGNVTAQFPAAAASVHSGVIVDYTVSLGTAPAPPSVDPEPTSPCDDPAGDCGGCC